MNDRGLLGVRPDRRSEGLDKLYRDVMKQHERG